ncbi:HAD family hydrolase [Deinococcus apachensis]|uniref:HAD family hydrolase n=1 Tax=Deinococcus apachensis TaxID=309886 RepID=UPI00036A5681|nr:HAD family phosphatase [Deinococcus apachensis]
MTTSSSSGRLRAVLFDRDDTLAYADPGVYREAALWASKRFGVDPKLAGRVLAGLWQEHTSSWWDLRTHEEEEVFWAHYGEQLGTRLGLDAGQAAQVLAAFPYERYLRPVEGAWEVLIELRARGLRVGVLSNTLPSIDRTLTALGLDDGVDVAVASCVVGAHKPEGRAFTYALERLGLPAGEVLFVDDRLENVEAARALGMKAVQIDLSRQVPGVLHSLWGVLALVDGPVPA